MPVKYQRTKQRWTRILDRWYELNTHLDVPHSKRFSGDKKGVGLFKRLKKKLSFGKRTSNVAESGGSVDDEEIDLHPVAEPNYEMTAGGDPMVQLINNRTYKDPDAIVGYKKSGAQNKSQKFAQIHESVKRKLEERRIKPSAGRGNS